MTDNEIKALPDAELKALHVQIERELERRKVAMSPYYPAIYDTPLPPMKHVFTRRNQLPHFFYFNDTTREVSVQKGTEKVKESRVAIEVQYKGETLALFVHDGVSDVKYLEQEAFDYLETYGYLAEWRYLSIVAGRTISWHDNLRTPMGKTAPENKFNTPQEQLPPEHIEELRKWARALAQDPNEAKKSKEFTNWAVSNSKWVTSPKYTQHLNKVIERAKAEVKLGL